MVACWEGSFPPWQTTWRVPFWTVLSTLEVLRYCCEPTGQLLVVLAVLGGCSLWRRGQRGLVVVLVCPLALAFVASFLQAYPYGGSRVLVYMTPAVVLLIGEGAGLVVARGAPCRGLEGQESTTVHTIRQRLERSAALVCMLLMLAPLGRAVHRVIVPWPRADCAGAAAHILASRRPGELVVGQHWEYAYYFRRLGPEFTLTEGLPPATATRLWYAATAGDLTDRLRLVDALERQGWTSVRHREFERSSVFYLVRHDAQGPTPGRPH
jgi:hypothetical protein